MTYFYTVASFFRRGSLLWKELLTITFNPNFVTLYASITHDSLSILWAFLTNSVSCSSTRFHLPKTSSTLAAFFTFDIWSWCTWLWFKFVAMAAGAGLACWPSRGVRRVGPFLAWYADRCLILFAERWKSRRTLFTRQNRGTGTNFDERLQMSKKRKTTQTFGTSFECVSSSDFNITIQYDLVIVLFLRKNYGVHSKMYSVAYGSSARVIQSGTGRAANGRRYFWPDTTTAHYGSLCPGDECCER